MSHTSARTRRLLPLLLSLIALVTTACDSAATDSDGANCIGGKCDGVSTPPPLEAISLEGLGACWGKIDDSTTDVFFQVHELHCDFHVPRGLVVDRIYTDTTSASLGSVGGGAFDGDALSGTAVRVARIRNSDFPIHLRVTIPMRFEGSSARTVYWGFERDISGPDELAGLSIDTPMTIDVPFALYPVVLWPSVELANAWDAGEVRGLFESLRYDVPITSGALAVGGPSPATAAQFERSELLRASEVTVRDLTVAIRMLPAPVSGFATPPELSAQIIGGDGEAQLGAITGPGYYLVSPDGSIALTAPEDLPRFAEDAPTTLDGGTVVIDDDASVMPEPDAGPETPADPCEGACAVDQACVSGACVGLASQTQTLSSGSTTFCLTATHACDVGEDADCAAGHACVAGLCRRLSCQVQPLSGGSTTFCNAANQPCDESDDCDVGHTCAGGQCRRLACQNQPLSGGSTTFCNAATQPCDDSTDCAEAHACVAGQCRRLACQNQPLSGGSTVFCNAATQPCAIDGDCADDHACVGAQCRRLVCQNQPLSGGSTRFCSAATQPCEEDSDCAEAHACVDALCKRVSCL